MSIEIIRHGTPEPPEEDWKCPECGFKANEYEREKYQIPDSFLTSIEASRLLGDFGEMPLVPTFICPECTCKWQWIPDFFKVKR